MKQFLFISLTLLLTACGAGDRGYVVTKVDSNGSIGKITHVTLPAAEDEIKFDTCYPMNRVWMNAFPADAAVANLFQGMAACPSTSHADIIKIKAGSLPSSQRVCVIAAISPTLYKEACMTITGEQNVQVEVKNATKVYVIREIDLSAFRAYANYTSNFYPAYATAAFAFVSTAK